MEFGMIVWFLILCSPLIIGVPYEFYLIFKGERRLLTHMMRDFVDKYPRQCILVASTYSWLWGLVLGHLFWP